MLLVVVLLSAIVVLLAWKAWCLSCWLLHLRGKPRNPVAAILHEQECL